MAKNINAVTCVEASSGGGDKLYTSWPPGELWGPRKNDQFYFTHRKKNLKTFHLSLFKFYFPGIDWTEIVEPILRMNMWREKMKKS